MAQEYIVTDLISLKILFDLCDEKSSLCHRIWNNQKGHSSQNRLSLCPHACRITHVHYAGSGQSIAFSGQLKLWNGYSAIILASQLHKNRGTCCTAETILDMFLRIRRIIWSCIGIWKILCKLTKVFALAWLWGTSNGKRIDRACLTTKNILYACLTQTHLGKNCLAEST